MTHLCQLYLCQIHTFVIKFNKNRCQKEKI
jgi:hypothetical protein